MKQPSRFLGLFCAAGMIAAAAMPVFAVQDAGITDAGVVQTDIVNVDNAAAGTPFASTTEEKDIDLKIGSEIDRVKIWVYCEIGEMNAQIVDANGKIIKKIQTLVAGSEDPSFVFYFNREKGYTGTYYLRVESPEWLWGSESDTNSGYYHWVQDQPVVSEKGTFVDATPEWNHIPLDFSGIDADTAWVKLTVSCEEGHMYMNVTDGNGEHLAFTDRLDFDSKDFSSRVCDLGIDPDAGPYYLNVYAPLRTGSGWYTYRVVQTYETEAME